MKVISPESYLFPGDEEAMEAINKIPQLSKVLAFISKNSIEKFYSIIFSSSYIKLTSANAPKLYHFYEEAAEAFGLDQLPEIYLRRGYQYKTDVVGIDNPMILINTSVLEDIPEEMLRVFLASDIAGIKAGHNKMNFIRLLCDNFADSLPIPKQVLTVPLLMWSKQKYYSYDRARMMYSHDKDMVLRLIGYGEAPPDIMERVTPDERIQQGMEFLEIDGVQSIAKSILTMSEAKPWNSMRVIEFNNWIESGMYKIGLEERI